jgi:circadian clock protein KaiB
LSVDAPRREWELRLYVAGMTPTAKRALANLEKICAEHVSGRYRIEIVDLFEQPWLAEGAQIVAVPTLVRQIPPPLRKLIGDFSDTNKVVAGLDLHPAD